MNDKHRYFLQFLMAKRIAKAIEIRNFFLKYCVEGPSTSAIPRPQDDLLVQFVSQINTHIRPLQLEIKKGFFEENGQTFFALINTMDNNITRLSSDYTVPELELFKKVLIMLLESEDGEVSSSSALNASSQLEHRLTKSSADIILKKFTDNDILRNNEGIISLSAFCLMELDGYLRSHFPDYVKFCFLCKQIVLKGRTCDSCEKKFHLHCAEKFVKNQSDIRCPNCKTQWSHNEETSEESLSRTRKKVRLSS